MTASNGAQSDRMSRVQWIALLFLASALRTGVLWQYAGSLAEDRDNYRRIAKQVVAGNGFVDPVALTPTAYRPPLYPLFVAAILVCRGGHMAIGIAQLLLGVATVALTVLCGRRLQLGRASLAAGLVVAVDPLLLHQTALVMTETLAAFLAALILWLSLDKPSPARNLRLGFVFGLSCLCRPTFWAFGALAGACWCFTCVRAWKTEKGQRMRATLSITGGLLLAIAPWGIRNALVMGWPVITTTHGGYTLLLAHNPAYTRAVVERPWGAVWEGAAFEEWSAALEAELARENPPLDVEHLTPAVELARDAWMNRRARDNIRSEPLVAARSGLTLLGRFWGVMPLATKNTPLSRTARMLIATWYTAVLIALVCGTLRIKRADWRPWLPLLTLIAGFTLVHSLYWADMRMRTPLVPAIALIAAACLTNSACSHSDE
jgi:4-amino-4-deoxy-L-arabinose transferase-like glycosyltransferase